MKVVAYLNNGSELIKNPVIVIAESEKVNVSEIIDDIPANLMPVITEQSLLPDRSFIKAWDISEGSVGVNMGIAKAIGHEMRRNERAKEFAPLDEQIMKQLPNTDVAAVEAERQAIREKYAVIQQQIDSASTPEQIKEALGVN